jgi:hypothetical protein
MQICRVVGVAVATIKEESLRGLKLLVVQPATTRQICITLSNRYPALAPKLRRPQRWGQSRPQVVP